MATLLGLVSMVLTSRIYGVRVIGAFALVSAPVAALWVLSTVKEQQALIREIATLPPRHPRVTQLFAVVLSFSFLLTALVAAIAAAVCLLLFPGPLHAPQLLAPALVNLAGYALITNTGWNLDSIFQAFVAGREIFWVRLHELCCFMAIAVGAGLVRPSVWSLVLATVGASATALVHRVWWVRRFARLRISPPEFCQGLRVLPSLLQFGIRATPGQIAQGISQQGGVWALGVLSPVGLVGAYSRAQMIPQRLQQASMRVSEVLYPTLVGRHEGGDRHGFDRALVDSIRYEAIGMLLVAAVLGGAARSVLQVFGPGFGRAAGALTLLALFPALASITVTQTQALWATNRPGLASLIAIARLFVTIALLVVLTPRLGVTGPAIALLAGYVVVVLLSGLALKPTLARPLRVTWPIAQRIALMGAYVAGFAAAALVQESVAWPLCLPLSMIAGSVAYVSAFLLARGLNERDRHRLREAAQRARSFRTRRNSPRLV